MELKYTTLCQKALAQVSSSKNRHSKTVHFTFSTLLKVSHLSDVKRSRSRWKHIRRKEEEKELPIYHKLFLAQVLAFDLLYFEKKELQIYQAILWPCTCRWEPHHVYYFEVQQRTLVGTPNLLSTDGAEMKRVKKACRAGWRMGSIEITSNTVLFNWILWHRAA